MPDNKDTDTTQSVQSDIGLPDNQEESHNSDSNATQSIEPHTNLPESQEEEKRRDKEIQERMLKSRLTKDLDSKHPEGYVKREPRMRSGSRNPRKRLGSLGPRSASTASTSSTRRKHRTTATSAWASNSAVPSTAVQSAPCNLSFLSGPITIGDPTGVAGLNHPNTPEPKGDADTEMTDAGAAERTPTHFGPETHVSEADDMDTSQAPDDM